MLMNPPAVEDHRLATTFQGNKLEGLIKGSLVKMLGEHGVENILVSIGLKSTNESMEASSEE